MTVALRDSGFEIPGIQIPVARDPGGQAPQLVDVPGLEDSALGASVPQETPGSLSLAVSLGSNNELVLPTLSVSGHTHFPAFQETVDSGPGNLAPPSGFTDWDSSIHAPYAEGSFPYSASEGFLTADLYPGSDPGRSGPFPLAMEVNYRVGTDT